MTKKQEVCPWAEEILENFSPNRVREIINEHFTKAQRTEYLESLERIEARASDDTLRVAVIGEFSSGKSTFINALMKRRLLKSATQATTAAGTHIRFGKKLSLKAMTTDGKEIAAEEKKLGPLNRFLKTKGADECSGFAEALASLSADERVAACIERIDVSVPCDFSIPELEIIDTPGFNSGEKKGARHCELSAKIAKDYADCGIVVIPALQANSAELLNFLKANMGAYLDECVFVLSQADRLDEDLAEFLDDVRETLRKRLALKKQPELFPVNSQSELREGDSSNLTPWRERFAAMENALRERMTRNRIRLLGENLKVLCENLCKALSEDLEKKRGAAEDEKKFLERNEISRIEDVTRKMLADAEATLAPTFARMEKLLKNEFSRRANAAENEIKEDISIFGDEIEDLKAHIECDMSSALDEFKEYAKEKIEEFKKTVSEQNRAFQAEFKRHYRDFPTVGAKVSFAKIPFDFSQMDDIDLSGAQDYLQSQKSQADSGSTAGMVGGGLLGAFVGGPIGAAAGIWLGGKIGRFFSEDSDDEKEKKLREQILPEVKKRFAATKTEFLKTVSDSFQKTMNAFRQRADEHVRKYGENVGEQLKAREEKLHDLRNRLTSIRVDLKFLKETNF